MFGLGWLQSWWMVPAANQVGPNAYSGLLGNIWALSVPVGAFIVAIGAALVAKAERRVLVLLVLLLVASTAWQMVGTAGQMIPALFGVGGGLITLFFLGSAWNWAKTRPTLTGARKTGADLSMIGSIFFVLAAWQLCGIFSIASFALRPELAARFSVPTSNTINTAAIVNILLVLGWGFNYLGQVASRRAHAANLEVYQARQVAIAD
jgi:hypothetical protein